ncbi:hypothetical protein HYW74_03595 [Candidatus Pacearchaeota archaeon]|nr:hypothetical protein [Candidatus Pacearchaeota archaeon]
MFLLIQVSAIILGLIYYIFILILVIQLHKKDYLSTTDTVITAIIIPLAPIYYLTNIRKKLKNFESTNPTEI